MHLIDLHCDTLYKSVINNISLNESSMDVKPLSEDTDFHKLQCYAIWMPDDLSGDDSENLFYKAYNMLVSEAQRLNIKLAGKNDCCRSQFINNINSAYFTVENGSALNGKIENIKKFADMGVKIITLTWNGSNDIGDGAKVHKSRGLTKFGKTVVSEMERESIVIDISHASDKLFYDVMDIATKPVIATHSNSRYITNNLRNLTDDQVKIIINCGGIIGLNFHNEFLNNNSDKANMFDIIKHTEHFLSIGAENNLCFGSDFDGCTLPNSIKGSESMDEIYEMFLRHNYKESVINKIFYGNALKFFENFDIRRIM